MSKSRRYIVFLCTQCKKDSEMHFLGYFLSGSSKEIDYPKSCGCSASFRHTDKTARITLKREASNRGYEFIGFVDGNFKSLMTTKIVVKCPKHGEWRSCTAANFLNKRSCPECAYDKRVNSKIKTDKAVRLNSLAKEKGFTILTEIYKNTKNSHRINVLCHNCNNEFDLTIDNFLRDRGCPCCAGKNQKYLYLNVIRDESGVNTDFMKIGITNHLARRLEAQNSRNTYKMFHMHTWEFEKYADCKACEKFIKQRVIKGSRPLDKTFFRDGYSEVLSTTDYMDVIDIVYDFGGKEVLNCKLMDIIEEMFKDNIIR